jgi:hypothetical protein
MKPRPSSVAPGAHDSDLACRHPERVREGFLDIPCPSNHRKPGVRPFAAHDWMVPSCRLKLGAIPNMLRFLGPWFTIKEPWGISFCA